MTGVETKSEPLNGPSHPGTPSLKIFSLALAKGAALQSILYTMQTKLQGLVLPKRRKMYVVSQVLLSSVCPHPPLLLTLIRKRCLRGQESGVSSHVPDSLMIWTEGPLLVSATCARCMSLARAQRGCWGSASCLEFIKMDLKSIHETTAGQMGVTSRRTEETLEHQLVYIRITWGRSQKGLTLEFPLSPPPKGILTHCSQDWVPGPG